LPQKVSKTIEAMPANFQAAAIRFKAKFSGHKKEAHSQIGVQIMIWKAVSENFLALCDSPGGGRGQTCQNNPNSGVS
jgi:hypothetical protein